MTAVAFYAPMKSPLHPVPSGDRAMARALIHALELTGYSAGIASEFVSRDAKGDVHIQDRLRTAAQTETNRLLASAEASAWQVWITYHNYYKAPDLIGPAVARALNIPYLLVEATRARKRLAGPWAGFAETAEAASDAANAIFYLTEHDAETLRAHRPENQELIHLRPFLPSDTLPAPTDSSGPMLSIGMLRQGDKLASYRVIAETLHCLRTPDWRLDIAGDGPARAQIEMAMKPFGDRVRFLGELPGSQLEQVLAHASLLLWPGVNEAFGMAYLEAQAAGLPVVAQNRPGVRDVLAPADYPSSEAGPEALARKTERLLSDDALRRRAGADARAWVGRHHLITSAADTLSRTISDLLQ